MKSHFPDASRIAHSGHWLPNQGLVLYGYCLGDFDFEGFETPQLSVPYLIRDLPRIPEQWEDHLLQDTARRSLHNLPILEQSQVVGCYFCNKVLNQEPVRSEIFDDQPATGQCPDCHQPTLLGGNPSELTPKYLQAVHDAWLRP